MNIVDYAFQADAEDRLFEQLNAQLRKNRKSKEQDRILFLSIVASGKTKMVSKVADMIAETPGYENVAFFFFSPSSAQLHDNAYQEIKKYGWPNIEVMRLKEMVAKADANGGNVPVHSFTTIGWSDVNKSKKNVQMKRGEQATFASIVDETKKQGKTRIVCLYDEGHLNQDRQRILKDMIEPDAEVIITATSKKKDLEIAKDNMHVVPVDTSDVIAEGKIKSSIIVNDSGMSDINDDENKDVSWTGLIRSGLYRRQWLQDRYAAIGMSHVIPLMVIQLPNDDISDSKDATDTIRHKDEVLEILFNEGVSENDILIWLAVEKTIDPNTIKNTNHKVLIVKVACATGWNCPRAMPLVKLRNPSKSDTLDEQTMGRFMRTVDPVEWLTNKAYREDEYLNAAFVYTASEEYDASLRGYSIQNHASLQTMRNDHKGIWEQIHLVKILPGGKNFDRDRFVREFSRELKQHFPKDYAQLTSSTDNNLWLPPDKITRRLAVYKDSTEEMMDSIELEGRRATSGTTEVDIADNEAEAYVCAMLKRSSSLRVVYSAILSAINEHMKYLVPSANSASMLSVPGNGVDEISIISVRSDFFKGVYSHFGKFAEVCRSTIRNSTEYYDDIVYDNTDGRSMYTPPVEMFTNAALTDTKKKETFAFDKKPMYGSPESEKSLVAEYLAKKMDTWFKNGTRASNSFVITYELDGQKHKFFPDFLAIKDRCLYIIETKGKTKDGSDKAIDPKSDVAKSKAIASWRNLYATSSTGECVNIDRIEFGIAKKMDNAGWKIYMGNGDDYNDFYGGSWESLDDVMAKN